jgi:hypothetical protein
MKLISRELKNTIIRLTWRLYQPVEIEIIHNKPPMGNIEHGPKQDTVLSNITLQFVHLSREKLTYVHPNCRYSLRWNLGTPPTHTKTPKTPGYYTWPDTTCTTRSRLNTVNTNITKKKRLPRTEPTEPTDQYSCARRYYYRFKTFKLLLQNGGRHCREVNR